MQFPHYQHSFLKIQGYSAGLALSGDTSTGELSNVNLHVCSEITTKKKFLKS